MAALSVPQWMQNSMPRWALWALGALGAGLQALGVCWPVHALGAYGAPLWWLQIVGLALWCAALHGCASARQAWLLGWGCATLWLVATFWWLFISMHTYGGLPAVLAVLAVLALAAALGLPYALAGLLAWRLRQRPSGAFCLAFGALWAMAELMRGTWLTGFGWGAIGYAHADGPLALWAPLLGSYGMAGVAAWAAASLACVASIARRRAGVVHGVGMVHGVALALVLGAGLGMTRWELPQWSSPNGTLSATLLQGNIAQDEKFESLSGVPQALAWYAQALQDSRSDLVVAPETAIPLLPQDLPEGYWEGLRQHFAQGRTAALVGMPLGTWETGYTNSVQGLRPGSEAVWRYDKHHLVPFGEFIPPLFHGFMRLMHIPLGDFNRGALAQAPMVWQGQRLGVHICYEDLFGEELAARFTDPAQAPTVLVNTSNIAWFGDSIALAQHLQIARLRALELERPVLRATNTGMTVAIDHRARITAALPAQTVGVLQAQVEGRNGSTPYAWWAGRWGLAPLWLLALCIYAAAHRHPARHTPRHTAGPAPRDASP